MNCDAATRLLLDRLAGRLDDQARVALDEHLNGCAACRQEAAAQTDVSRVLAARPDADVSPSFAARLAGRLREEAGWFGLADWRWLSVRLAPAAALLLFGAGIVIERQAAEQPQPLSLSRVFETWTTGESDRVPVRSVLWQQDVSEDAVLLTVLTAPSDATIARQTDER